MWKCVLVLALMASFSVSAANDCAVGEENCWECGDNCTARFDPQTKTFQVSGTGQMAGLATDGQAANVPWSHIAPLVKEITFEGSLQSISMYAFYRMPAENVTIPDTVTTIGFGAFYENHALQNITIPDSVTKIGSHSFYNTNIKNIVIPDSVKFIENSALLGCPKLQTLTIGENTQLNEIFGSTIPQNLKIYCTGDTTKCDANLEAAGYPELKSIGATTKQANGVTYVFDNKGKLVTTSGRRTEKRIYTIDEANIVAGKVNSVKIRYR